MSNTVPGKTIGAVDAEIQYLLPTSLINRRFVSPGAELNTGIYKPHSVRIGDARAVAKQFTLDEHGFTLATHETAITDWRDDDIVNAVYPGEVVAKTIELTGADFVAPLGGMFRSTGETMKGVQPPAGEAHVDFNTPTAHMIASSVYENARSDGPGYDRFIAFSFWRAISPPPQSWPLALCEGPSIGDDEGVPNVKIDVERLPEDNEMFAEIPGEENMGAASIFHFEPAHRWWYYPDMTTDEIIFIKFHDTDHARAWRAMHTAFHDTSRPQAKIRESYEFRGIAYFEKKA